MLDIILVVAVCTAFLLGLIWLVQKILPKAINPPNEKVRPIGIWVIRLTWIAILFGLWFSCVVDLLMGNADVLKVISGSYLTIYLPFSIYSTIIPWLQKAKPIPDASPKRIPSETGDA